MADKIIVKAHNNHSKQWLRLKRYFVKERGSDAGENKKAIPRTTHDDVKQLTAYWQGEYKRAPRKGPKGARMHWPNAKAKIDQQLANGKPDDLYPENEWFWQKATHRLALQLEAWKVIPSRTELFYEALKETLSDHAERVKDAGATVRDKAKETLDDAASIGDKAVGILKTAAIIGGVVVGAAVVLPPIVRAFRDE
jgi:hypothetical protein